MSSSLRVEDREWRRIKREIRGLKRAEVKVGVQSDAGASDDGTPLASIAFWNEFGTNGGGWGGPIPARPFMRDTFDTNRLKYSRTIDRFVGAVLAGRTGLRRGLTVLGEMTQDDIQQAIVGGGWAPNSPVTVALKGSSTPLVDTGSLRQSIRYEVNT